MEKAAGLAVFFILDPRARRLHVLRAGLESRSMLRSNGETGSRVLMNAVN
jgi:hypothetical protein